MKTVQHFELDQNTASRHHADADCRIRVISGRVWLTVEGQAHDVWLDADAEHAFSKGSTVWLSAEALSGVAYPARITIIAKHESTSARILRFLSRKSRRESAGIVTAQRWFTAA
jgi:hypothetical protein